jgi:hypothetical protein
MKQLSLVLALGHWFTVWRFSNWTDAQAWQMIHETVAKLNEASKQEA